MYTQIEWIAFMVPLTLGLMSSYTHCLGMCGPLQFILLKGNFHWKQWLIYHFSKIISYVMLGVLSGAIGSVVHAKEWVMMPKITKIIMIGLFLITAIYFALGKEGVIEKLLSKILPVAWIHHRLQSASSRKLPWLGFLTGFLPCPTTYAAVVWALGMGSPKIGGLGMLLFGISMMPAFLGLALAGHKLQLFSRNFFRVAVSLLFASLAFWNIYSVFIKAGPIHSCH